MVLLRSSSLLFLTLNGFGKCMLDLETRSAKLASRHIELGDEGRTVCKDYRDFIGELAVKFTGSTDEAVAAYRDMYDDIARFEGANISRKDEQRLIERIALRRLIRYLR